MTHEIDQDETPMNSRTIAGPLGKLDCEMKTKVDEHTQALFLQICRMRGSNSASVQRDCIYAIVHGKTYSQMLAEKMNHEAERTAALAKLIGPFGAPELMGGNHV